MRSRAYDLSMAFVGLLIVIAVAVVVYGCGDDRTPAQVCRDAGSTVLKTGDDGKEVICKNGREFDKESFEWVEDED